MRFTIEGSHFKRILGLAKGCVPARATMPIVQHVLLRAEGSTLTVTATNLEREITVAAPAQMDRGGVIAVPGKILCDFSQRLLPGAQVGFELDPGNGRVTVTSGSGVYVFKTLDGADYPTIGQLQSEATEFTVTAKDLLALLATNYAASGDVRDFSQFGVRLQVYEGKLEAIGFDGSRMGRRVVPVPAGAEALRPVTVPQDAIAEICRVVADAEEVRISVGSLFQVATPSLLFTTKVMAGNDKDQETDDLRHRAVHHVLTQAKPVGKIHPTVLKDALRRASVVYASGLNKYEPAVVEFTDSGVILSMGEGDSETAREELDAEVLGPPNKFRVKREFLDDVMEQWPENVEVTFCMLDEPARPVLLRNDKDPDGMHFIAQMMGAIKSVAKQQQAA